MVHVRIFYNCLERATMYVDDKSECMSSKQMHRDVPLFYSLSISPPPLSQFQIHCASSKTNALTTTSAVLYSRFSWSVGELDESSEFNNIWSHAYPITS